MGLATTELYTFDASILNLEGESAMTPETMQELTEAELESVSGGGTTCPRPTPSTPNPFPVPMPP
jgi:bacteriocin-like protein